MKKSKLFLILLIIAMIALIAVILVLIYNGTIPGFGKNDEKKDNVKRNSLGQIDDWCYDPDDSEYDSYRGLQYNSGAKYMSVDSAAVSMEEPGLQHGFVPGSS